jgi:DNA-binding response OmpR family regulator
MSEIVIIEEDKLMRGLLAEWLSAEGYRVRTWDGPAIGPTGNPDLVIVDVYMPRHIGSTRIRAVQSALPGVPVIAISCQFRSGIAADGTAARALGAHQVIAKPFGRDELVSAVRTVIGPAN